ncbi:MAG: zinc ribbon domain-containing protein [Capsulimonadales bacterium]|nr:zinc ribbon domain-containing protein [Capsulimonadales bacterium]
MLKYRGAKRSVNETAERETDLDTMWIYLAVIAALPVLERLIDRAGNENRVACSDCGERIRIGARVCRYCGHRFPSGIAGTPVETPTSSDSDLTGRERQMLAEVRFLRRRLRAYRSLVRLLIITLLILAWFGQERIAH